MKYFDWTATTPIINEALEEYCRVSKDVFGNPSSTHSIGFEAKNLLESNRIITAKLLGIKFNNLIYTSGGTESDTIIIQSFLNSPNPGEILTTSIEHSAILENKRIMEKFGWKFTEIACPNGLLDVENLKHHLNPNVRLVCLMKVNNVVGSIVNTEQTIAAIREYEKINGRKIHIHCDAVQALGKVSFSPEKEGIDSAAYSSHKIGGPKGIGVLYNSNPAILSLSKGGGQEKGIRPGTENLPAICAFNVALKKAIENLDENYKTVNSYREILVNKIKDTGIKILSPMREGQYSPYLLSISVIGVPSEVFLRVINDKGFCLSAGSACSSNSRGKAESVLNSMKFTPEERMSTIRISISNRNTKEEITELANAIIQTYGELNNAKH